MNNLKIDEQLCFPLYVCSKEKAKQVSKELEKCLVIDEDDVNTLKEILSKIMKKFN